MKKMLAAALCAAMLFSLTACGSAAAASTAADASPVQTAGPVGAAAPNALTCINDYSVLLSALSSASQNSAGRGGVVYTAQASGAENAAAPAADGTETQTDPQTDYSRTNAQVEGVDEGDIVKTDGQYLYVLSGYDLHIFTAGGPDTRELSHLTLGYDKSSEGEQQDWSYSGKTPQELYVSGTLLAVISDCYDCRNYADAAGAWQYDSKNYTSVDIYDVSDPSSPALKVSLGQDGGETASRLTDGRIYLISSWGVYNYDETDPRTYVPQTYKNGEGTLLPADEIAIMPRPADASYAVICVYDLASGTMTDSQTVMGAGDTVYMNDRSLYLAAWSNVDTASDPRTESVYTVVDYTTRSATEICRFAVNGDGTVTAGSVANVDGSLENQFSMDETDGKLRVVTTLSGYDYSVYTDEAMGFENTKEGDPFESSAALYVLDSETMSLLGSVTGLASGEQVYSVRFDGSWAYFCTYQTVDPLFAVDVSDPANPVVASALKIDGFSEYLHVWSDGLLFGLGRDTQTTDSADGGAVTTAGGMKLVMFDISDKSSVTAASTLTVDEDWSEALYNHKAILIDPEKNIIGFPAGTGYDIYGWTAAQGFFLRARIETNSDWSSGVRGLYAGDYAYIVSGSDITVVNLDTFILSAKIAY